MCSISANCSRLQNTTHISQNTPSSIRPLSFPTQAQHRPVALHGAVGTSSSVSSVSSASSEGSSNPVSSGSSSPVTGAGRRGLGQGHRDTRRAEPVFEGSKLLVSLVIAQRSNSPKNWHNFVGSHDVGYCYCGPFESPDIAVPRFHRSIDAVPEISSSCMEASSMQRSKSDSGLLSEGQKKKE